MGQVLHGSTRTTGVVRRARQHNQESPRSLSKCYGINQKTGPKEPKWAILSVEDRAIIVAFPSPYVAAV